MTTDPRELHQRVREQSQELATQQQTAMTPVASIQSVIAKNMNRITQALPEAGMTPERLATVAFLMIRKNPKLLECSPESLVDCVIRSAQLGLDLAVPNNAHMVPYGTEATFQIGYMGMIELSRRSGEMKSIVARPVFEGDDFRYSFGLKDDLHHVPGDGEQTWDNLTHVYLVAKFVNGGHHLAVMSKAQIEAHRDQFAKGLDLKKYGEYTSPWRTNPIPMALKTIVRQEWRWLPVSTEVRQKVAEVEAAEVEVIEGKPAGAVWLDGMLDAPPKGQTDPEPQPDAKPEAAASQTKAAKKKAETKPEPEQPKEQTAYCRSCGATQQVSADCQEEDLFHTLCDSCQKPDMTLTAPKAAKAAE